MSDLISFLSRLIGGLLLVGAGFVVSAHSANASAAEVGLTRSSSSSTGRGSVGVGTYTTVAQFKDLVVSTPESRTLYIADFSKSLDDWYFHGGQWKVVDDFLKQSSNDRDCWATIGETAWTNYTVSVKARKITGDEGFILLFRVLDNNNYAWFNVGGWKNTKAQLEICVKGSRNAIGPATNFTVESNRWYDLKVEVEGEKAKCYVDGKMLCNTDLSHGVSTATSEPSTKPSATSPRPETRSAVASAPASRPPAAAPAGNRVNTLRGQLQNMNEAVVLQGLRDFKQWFAQDPINAEHGFWQLRTLFPPSTRWSRETLDLVQLAWAAKDRPDGDHSDPGYLYALEASCLMQLHKPDEALARLKLGIQADLVHASKEFIACAAKTLPPTDADTALSEIFPPVIAGAADDLAAVETALKLRISVLNRLGRHSEALSDARSYFNVCSMRHAAEALTLLDNQLKLTFPNEKVLLDKFRQEEIDGALLPNVNTPPNTSKVVTGLVIRVPAYDEALHRAKNTTFEDAIRKTSLLLLVGNADEALASARQAAAIASSLGGANYINAADDLIARCYKAQDGTLGRANAFVMTIRPTTGAATGASPPVAVDPNIP